MSTLAPILAAATACGGGPSVSGKIDGERVSVAHAYFVVDENAVDGDDLVRIYLSDVSCDDAAAYIAALEQVDGPDAQAAAWADTHPVRFWQLNLRAVTPGLEAGTWATDVDAVHYLRDLDAAYWDDGGTDEYTVRYAGSGDLEVTAAFGDLVEGTIDASLARIDGEGGGDVAIAFSAGPCPGLE